MSTREIYNIGTTIYYEGDEANKAGFGRITQHRDNYLGELELTITMEDGRVLYDVTPDDFEAKTVQGNKGCPEFQIAEGELVRELDEFDDCEEVEEFAGIFY